jgi:hypothetical protein
MWHNRAFRRLALAVLWLAVFDRLVDQTLSFLERERYERGAVVRFENSDLFGLGPLVEYLREHPHGERPRTLFFGNSVVWGYGLAADAAAPAQLQRLEPGVRIFNVAINGFETGSSYLVAKAVVDSVDRLYVLLKGSTANPMLPSLIPIAAEDVRAFNLTPPDRVESALERGMGWWHLYRSSYRLQSALFGSSTRQYIYLHKGELTRSAIATVQKRESPPVQSGKSIDLDAPQDANPAPDVEKRFARQFSLAWRLGMLARDHGKRLTLMHIAGYSGDMAADDIAAFNRLFDPYATIAVLRIPPALSFDGVHLTAEGSEALAEALVRYERAAAERQQ